jgi:predicted metal-dependent peptidase
MSGIERFMFANSGSDANETAIKIVRWYWRERGQNKYKIRFTIEPKPNEPRGDIYLPSVESETVGELVIAIDTSGSIGQKELNEFASEIVSICETVTPERVRVLWWDTKVHGEQIFEPADFQQIGSLLKPKVGRTRVSCVAEYINKKQIKAA